LLALKSALLFASQVDENYKITKIETPQKKVCNNFSQRARVGSQHNGTGELKSEERDFTASLR
jgi:hypothetical protein